MRPEVTGRISRDSVFGFVLMILVVTLQVLIVTNNLAAAGLAFLGSSLLALAGLGLMAAFATPDSTPAVDQRWTPWRLGSTLLVFGLSLAAGTLRSLGFSGWAWGVVSVSCTALVLTGMLLRRQRS